MPVLALAVAACVWTPGGAAAQDADALPPVITALTGTWEGSGILLGRPAAFRMAWTPLRGDFVRLSFTNMWVADGDTTTVLTSEAVYRLQGSAALGVWIDGRPQQLTLSATLSDTSVVTDWTAPAENGRTEYVVVSSDQIVVRDYVFVDGAEQLFAEGTYARVGTGSR